MGKLASDFDELIKSKKDALQNYHGEQYYDKAAEMLYLMRIREEFKKEIESDDLVFRQYFDNEFAKGTYTPVRKRKIEGVKAKIKEYVRWLGISTGFTPLPEELYPYVISPKKFTKEKKQEVRDDLRRKGYAFPLYQKPAEGVTDDQVDTFYKEFHLKKTIYNPDFTAMSNVFSSSTPTGKLLDDAADTIHFLKGRSTTHANTFRMYLIGKKGFTVEEALNINPQSENFNELLEEYKQFFVSHPTDRSKKPILSAQLALANMREWVDMFANCADAMARFTIPEENFSDPQVAEKYFKQFSALAALTQDFGQQIEPMLKYNGDVFAMDPDLKKKAQEKSIINDTLRQFVVFFKNCYYSEDAFKVNPEVFARHLANNRILFQEKILPKFKGRTIGEVVADRTPYDLYEVIAFQNMEAEASVLPNNGLNAKDAIQFLKNGEGNYKNVLLDLMDGYLTHGRKSGFNQRIRNELRTYFWDELQKALDNNESFVKGKKLLFDTEYSGRDFAEIVLRHKDPEELKVQKNEEDEVFEAVQDLFAPEGENKTAANLNAIDEFKGITYSMFSYLFENNGLRELYAMAGVNPFDGIRINNKTPEELWGEKYAFLDSDKEKEIMYRMEIMREILKNDSKISVDRYLINDRNEIVKDGKIDLIMDRHTYTRTLAFLNEVNQLHTAMEEVRRGLSDNDLIVHEGTLTLPGDGKIYSLAELLGKMREQARVVERESAGNGSLDRLMPAINEYERLAKAFFDKEIELMQRNEESGERIASMQRKKQKLLTKVARFRDRIHSKSIGLNNVKASEHEISERAVAASFHYLQGVLSSNASLRSFGNPNDLFAEVALPGKYAWVANIDENEINQDELRAFAEENHLIPPEFLETDYPAVNEEIKKEKFDITGNKSTRQVLSESGLPLRGTLTSLFLLYALDKGGISIEELPAFARSGLPIGENENGSVYGPERQKFLEVSKNFVQFVMEHPFNKPADSPQKTEESILEWTKIFVNASGKIGEYRFPDIDYSDHAQVKEHFWTFHVMRLLAGDGFQEFDALLRNTTLKVDASRVASKEVAVKDIWGALKQYHDMQGVMSACFVKPYEILGVNNNISPQSLTQAQFMRIEAGNFMSEYAGKKVKDSVYLSEKKPRQTYYEAGVSSTLATASSIGSIEGINTTIENPMSKTFAVSLGYNRTSYENSIKEMEEEITRKMGRPSITDSTMEFQNHFRFGKWPKGLKERFAEVGDSVNAMKAFLEEEAEDGILVKDWICAKINRAFTGSNHALVHEMGYRESEMFTIGDRPASFVLHDKYSGIRDFNEKELLYRAEIMKAIAKGHENVGFRQFKFTDADTIQETGAKNIILDYSTMTAMIASFKRYQIERDNLLSRLKEVREELRKTQQDPRANFEGNENEGSPEYRGFASALQSAIKRLEKANTHNSVNWDEIEVFMTSLAREARAYSDSRKGFFKRNSSLDDIRIAKADFCKTDLLDPLTQRRRIFIQNMIARNGKLLENCTERELLDSMKDFRSIVDYEHTELNPEKIEDEYVREFLDADLNVRLKNSEQYKKIMAMENDSPDKIALRYLIGYTESLFAPDIPGKPHKMRKYADIREYEHIFDRVAEIKKNTVLLDAMKKNPEECIATWKEIEYKAHITIRNRYVILMNNLTNAGTLSGHVAGPVQNAPEDQNLTPAQRIRAIHHLEDNEAMANGIRQCYERMTDVVLYQILTSDSEDSKRLRESLTDNEEEKMQELKTFIRNHLQNNNLLSERNLNSTLRALDNESLARATFKQYLAGVKTSRTTRENERRRQLSDINQRIRFIGNWTPATMVTQEQRTTYNQTTNLILENPAEATDNAAANRLVGEIHYRVANDDPLLEQNWIPKTENIAVEDYWAVGLNGSTPSLIQGFFISYVMAKQKIGFTEACGICYTVPELDNQGNVTNEDALYTADALRAEFARFCKENPMRTLQSGNNVADAEKSMVAWAKIISEATDQMKSYVIPKINYHNVAEIKEKQVELNRFTQLCSQMTLEMPKLFAHNGIVNPERVTDKEIRKDFLYDTKVFWHGLRAATANFERGYLTNDFVALANLSADQYAKHVEIKAVQRYLGAADMQSFAGLTAAQAAHMSQNEQLIKGNMDLAGEIQRNILAGNHLGLNIKNATKYLTGQADKSFENAANKQIEEASPKATNKFIGQIVKGYSDFRNSLKFHNIKDDFTAEGEFTKESLDALLEKDVQISEDKTIKVKEWVNNQTSKLFTPEMLAAASHINTAPMNLIFVDGKTPEQKWGEKYKNADPLAKENYYKLELMREIALGRSEIKFTEFVRTGETVKSSGRLLYLPKKNQNLEKTMDSIHVYKAGLDKILGKLKGYRSLLINTQTNMLANFHSDETEYKTTQYRDMTQALRESIAVLDNVVNGHNVNYSDAQIRQAINNLKDRAHEYYVTHKGLFFRPRSTSGGRRLDASLDIYRDAIRWVKEISALHADYHTDLVCENGKELSVANLDQALKLAGKMGEFYDIPEKQPAQYTQMYYNGQLQRALNELEDIEFEILPGQDERHYEMAAKYLKAFYESKIQNNAATEADASFVRKSFVNKVKELAGNPVFQNSWLKRDRWTRNNWNIAERFCETIRQSTQTGMEGVVTRFGIPEAFITHTMGDPAQRYSKNQIVNEIMNNAGNREAYKQRFVSYVVNKIVTGNTPQMKNILALLSLGIEYPEGVNPLELANERARVINELKVAAEAVMLQPGHEFFDFSSRRGILAAFNAVDNGTLITRTADALSRHLLAKDNNKLAGYLTMPYSENDVIHADVLQEEADLDQQIIFQGARVTQGLREREFVFAEDEDFALNQGMIQNPVANAGVNPPEVNIIQEPPVQEGPVQGAKTYEETLRELLDAALASANPAQIAKALYDAQMKSFGNPFKENVASMTIPDFFESLPNDLKQRTRDVLEQMRLEQMVIRGKAIEQMDISVLLSDPAIANLKEDETTRNELKANLYMNSAPKDGVEAISKITDDPTYRTSAERDFKRGLDNPADCHAFELSKLAETVYRQNGFLRLETDANQQIKVVLRTEQLNLAQRRFEAAKEELNDVTQQINDYKNWAAHLLAEFDAHMGANMNEEQRQMIAPWTWNDQDGTKIRAFLLKGSQMSEESSLKDIQDDINANSRALQDICVLISSNPNADNAQKEFASNLSDYCKAMDEKFVQFNMITGRVPYSNLRKDISIAKQKENCSTQMDAWYEAHPELRVIIVPFMDLLVMEKPIEKEIVKEEPKKEEEIIKEEPKKEEEIIQQPNPQIQPAVQVNPVVQPTVVQPVVQPTVVQPTVVQPVVKPTVAQHVQKPAAAAPRKAGSAVKPEPKPVNVINNTINIKPEPKPTNPNKINIPSQPKAQTAAVNPSETMAFDWRTMEMPSSNGLQIVMLANGYSKETTYRMFNLLNSMNSQKAAAEKRAIQYGGTAEEAPVYMNPENVSFMDVASVFLGKALFQGGINKERDLEFRGQLEEFITAPLEYAKKLGMGTGINNSRRQNSWEFTLNRKTSLPTWITNTGNTKLIRDFYNKNKKSLSPDDAKLIQMLSSANKKIHDLAEIAESKMKSGEEPGKRLKITKTQLGGYAIEGTNQSKFQSSDNGCWSCSMALLLQSRGVNDLTQEEIRAFRPDLSENQAKNLGKDANEALNKDIPNKIIESGDLVTLLAPDSALREMEILPYNSQCGISEDEYIQRAEARLEAQIFKSIAVDKSPVSLRRADHYITITGVENRSDGCYIRVKDSIYHPGDTNPNREEWVSLNKMARESLAYDPMQSVIKGISISWMSDLTISAENDELMNLPISGIKADPASGKLTVDENKAANGKAEMDGRHIHGMNITTFGDAETGMNSLGKDRLFVSERAYLPKNVDYKFLTKQKTRDNNKVFDAQVKAARTKLETLGKGHQLSNGEIWKEKLETFVTVVSDVKIREKGLQPSDHSGKAMVNYWMKDENREILTEMMKNHSGKELLGILDKGKFTEELNKTKAAIQSKKEMNKAEGGPAVGK